MTSDILQQRMMERRHRANNLTYCVTCDTEIYMQNVKKCEICGRYGCSRCMKEHAKTGEIICKEDCLEQTIEKAAKKAATSGSRDDLQQYLRLRRRAEEERHEHQTTS